MEPSGTITPTCSLAFACEFDGIPSDLEYDQFFFDELGSDSFLGYAWGPMDTPRISAKEMGITEDWLDGYKRFASTPRLSLN